MPARRDFLFFYASQLYVTAIGILVVPLYIRFMGKEAYGLVGIYSMLLGWFQLLDFGLSPTLSREVARYNAGTLEPTILRRIVRVLEIIFTIVGIGGGVILAFSSSWIASHWIKFEFLSYSDAHNSLILIAAIICFRWISGIYRSAVLGFEKHIWLCNFTLVIGTARFLLVLIVFLFIGASPFIFFGYQLAIAIIETFSLAYFTYLLLPRMKQGFKIGFHVKSLKTVIKFSLTVAFTGAVWVSITQTDKLILSKLLSLSEYANFTLAVIVASSILILNGPLSMALLPRFSNLSAQNNIMGLVTLYRQATQGIVLIVAPVVVLLSYCTYPLLLLWTRDTILASQISPILRFYAIGNGVLVINAFPYYLQFAKGDLRLHLIGNILFLLLLVPTLWWFTLKNGAIGAASVWLIMNILYFLFWSPLVHKRLLPGLHIKWLIYDIGIIAITVNLLGWFLSKYISWPNGSVGVLFVLFAIGLITFITGAIISPLARGLIFSWVKGNTQIKLHS